MDLLSELVDEHTVKLEKIVDALFTDIEISVSMTALNDGNSDKG